MRSNGMVLTYFTPFFQGVSKEISGIKWVNNSLKKTQWFLQRQAVFPDNIIIN